MDEKYDRHSAVLCYKQSCHRILMIDATRSQLNAVNADMYYTPGFITKLEHKWTNKNTDVIVFKVICYSDPYV